MPSYSKTMQSTYLEWAFVAATQVTIARASFEKWLEYPAAWSELEFMGSVLQTCFALFIRARFILIFQLHFALVIRVNMNIE